MCTIVIIEKQDSLQGHPFQLVKLSNRSFQVCRIYVIQLYLAMPYVVLVSPEKSVTERDINNAFLSLPLRSLSASLQVFFFFSFRTGHEASTIRCKALQHLPVHSCIVSERGLIYLTATANQTIMLTFIIL